MKTNSSIRKSAFLLLCALAAHVWGAQPDVKIADVPPFGGHATVHPNMLLSLSVEFPTVGIAYRGDNGAYNRSNEYVGYFNPLKCYDYNGGNRNLTESGYFTILKNADPITHECGGGSFSGNFMNWASASAIDMLRYAMTGGDRVVDKGDLTILQRAVLPNTTGVNFYAHGTYFPRRVLKDGGNASAPSQVTPFQTDTLYIVSCSNRILFSDANSGISGGTDAAKASEYCMSVFSDANKDKPETTDKRLGEYLARVKVCDSVEGAVRTTLCQKYGTHYKPVGAIQRNSDRIRLGAMGYLLDDSAKRYGGVLRAPMKYVGPKKFEAPKFVAVDNDRAEWDPNTGEFILNPEGNNSVSRSGVIAYLNKFGDSGKYKRYDPVGELYYEGIRYLQGKAPTAEATANMTDAMHDGFPVITERTDPVVASCQKNYIVSIADVNTHWDRYIPGNTRTTYGNSVDANDAAREIDAAVVGKTPELDVKPWTEAVGKMEASRNANLADLHTKDTGSGGHGTYYMAGLAHWANTQDIRLDKKIRVKTFSIDVDEGGNGLIDGNNRTIKPRDSQLYLAAKYGGRIGNESECDASGDTPSNYFLASQPNEMIRSIRSVFDRIGGTSGTISGVSVSTTKISSDGAFVFQPGFNSSNWCGSLKKLRLSLDNDTVTIAKNAVWDAGEILTGKGETVANPQPADRKIYTSAIEGSKFLPSIPFKWETNDVSTGKDELTEGLKALFKTNPGNGAEDGHGMDRVRYLRGDRSLESSKSGGIFRARGSVLGDVINSNPLYVGPPALNVQGDKYQTFYDKNKARAKAVYVGANDGMLHAFSADDGRELFAYVPNVLIPALSQLTRPDYSHRAYMDGMMSVAEAKVDTEWKTVLAAGLGGGAQGVIALDVTNPSDFGGAIFEFTDADDKDMGNVVSAPVVAKFMTKNPKNAAPEYKYFLVVSSGLNNYKDDGIGKFNPDAPGVLFLLSLDKAPGAKWQVGRNYFKFTTQNTDATLQNGLGSPALVVGANGVVRYGYAGDLQGNLWRFDFTGAEPFSKKPPKPTLLFTANDEQGQRQPVATQPKVVFAPGGGYVVLFGTGKFLENTDVAPGEFKSQSFYGILDTTKSDYTVSGRTDLVKRVLETRDNGASLELTGNEFSYLDSKGWYFDFLDSATTGERSVTNGLVANGRIFFNTLIPGADPCSAGGGRTYILDTLTGMPQPTTDPLTGLPSRVIRTGFRSTVGMLSSPVVFDTSANVGDRNAIGRRKVTKNSSVFNFGTDGAAPAERIATDVPAGRFSWREILNWLDK